MSVENPYIYFNNYILRTPLLSFNFYKDLTQNWKTNPQELKIVCSDIQIREALFLGSPDLLLAITKWLNGELNEIKANQLRYSVFKYLSRMSTRCTPFGLFAGVSVGEFGTSTNIILKNRSNHNRQTRLDMNYLVALSQYLVKNQTIREQLLFYPNTSIYKIGSQFRYIEYEYIKSKRIHHLVGAKSSWYLEQIISAAQNGKTIKQLAAEITSDDLDYESCLLFIEELIENQILISELEPSLSGDDLLGHIIQILKKYNRTGDIVKVLENVNKNLTQIDSSFSNDISSYEKIVELLKKIEVKFDIKYLFQTDMKTDFDSNRLDKSIAKKVNDALVVLNKISRPQSNSAIKEFKKTFYDRYEAKPVKLTSALDNELGISFNSNNNFGEINSLIDDLDLPFKKNKLFTPLTNENPIENILHRKTLECIKLKKEVFILKDKDLHEFKENWEDLPDTMSALVEVVQIDGKEKVICNFVGGSSAANLLARFCHIDEEITNHVEKIIEVEKRINSDRIIAEIIHLPDSHIGNVLIRPHLRGYEIPYLATSTLKKEQIISINDLEVVATSPNNMAIRSIKHNKEVIPRLTTAHNYLKGSLPIYQFLSSSQNVNKRNGVGFSWGELEYRFPFLPRVEYHDVILSPKLWNIENKDIEGLISKLMDENAFKLATTNFIESKNLPQYVLLKEGDNELLINFKNELSIKMLLNTVRKKTKFQLKEFLHDKSNIVTSSKNSFTNQIILSFYNSKLIKSA